MGGEEEEENPKVTSLRPTQGSVSGGWGVTGAEIETRPRSRLRHAGARVPVFLALGRQPWCLCCPGDAAYTLAQPEMVRPVYRAFLLPSWRREGVVVSSIWGILDAVE